MFPATVTMPPLLTFFSTPIFPPKPQFEENETEDQEEVQKPVLSREYNTRSKERTTAELFGELLLATEIIEDNIALETLAQCCFEEFELLNCNSPWEFQIRAST